MGRAESLMCRLPTTFGVPLYIMVSTVTQIGTERYGRPRWFEFDLDGRGQNDGVRVNGVQDGQSAHLSIKDGCLEITAQGEHLIIRPEGDEWICFRGEERLEQQRVRVGFGE
ncbi:MAG TPA: hypothetical protein VJK08_01635 [Patescibacteria group bacterium]|nr:hypothetical protein [Patescibacteria group bacterium]